MISVDDETITFAHRLADAAGEVIRPYFRARIDVVDKRPTVGGKPVFDPVTEADKNAEAAIRAIIRRERPGDGILGEEWGEEEGTSGYRWVLDPVDGTRGFITGRHEWGSLIALEFDSLPILGVLDQPVLRERFVGANGAAHFHTGGEKRRLETRSCASLADAILCATHPDAYFADGEQAAFKRVEREVRMTRWGGDCYIFAALALGFVDLIVESTFNRWDIAALIPIVAGAGGIVTDWQGGDCSAGGQILAAGDARMHAAAVALLNSKS
ncbi:MAG: histidinol-phosphatase [Rhizomicrobium sp.]|jgi:myo-inositol-1(or 4)-monophosphatase